MNTDEMVSLALEVLEQESKAILRASERVDRKQLHKAISLILESSGKVVVIGTGKSGIAARKIAGTLTSTGTAAVFLHPVDALHGDLGVISREDVVIVISNSGETDEILALMVHLKKRGVPLVGIVGNLSSTLATHADAVLDASVDREAGSLGLAPTTSVTLAIVIGDAMSTILMKAKGFSTEDFAFIHPAGRLGKRLTLTVHDLMHGGSGNPTVNEQTGWMDILEAMTKGGLGAVSVVDPEGKLLGLITDGDVRRSTQKFGFDGLRSVAAVDIMTSNPLKVESDLLAYEALTLMEERPSQISVLPVVDDNNRSLGLIRLHDIVRAGLR